MRVFVSSQSVDHPPASLLIARLRDEGWLVAHSPSNPLDADDPRWPDWYRRGLPEALAETDVFIAVVDEAWDSSTWMAVEADEARKRLHARRCFSWNPNGLRKLAAGMAEYLRDPLPGNLGDAIAVLHAAEPDTPPAPGPQKRYP